MSSDSPGIRLPSAPAERIADNHVVYRRGNTRVHVQTYDAQQAEDIIKAKSNVFLKSGVSSFFSGILAMIIVVVTLVIKLSEAITTRITTNDVDTYMIMLYGICILWTLYYNVLSSLCGGVFSRIAKTNQSTNRWLKGVIIIFGTAIVLKDSMEFLSHTVDDSEECEAHYLSAVISALHLFFILNQSVFIFRYTKLFIPNNFLLPRTGIMFIIATNLSTWIESVVTETVVALNPSSAGHRSEETSTTSHVPTYVESNISEYGSGVTYPHNRWEQSMVAVDTDSCSCHSSLCNTVHVAEKFMFPFLVEFSLVASCMLYVTWRNIGRLPPPYEGVVKPSYQLFGSYFGVSLGSIASFATVIVIIVLATRTSPVELKHRSYFTELHTLLINNSYLVAVEICMILACLVGFYIFYINERPVVMESSALLDEVLLLICILGPLVSNCFSLLAVIAGTDNKTDERWVMTLIYPICDTFQCLLQVVLILFGLQREPETTDLAKETVEEIKKSFQEANQCSDDEDLEPGDEMQHIARTYLRSHHNSINYVLSALFHQQPPTNNGISQNNPLTRVPSRISISRNVNIGEVSVDSPNTERPLPQITANGVVAAESQSENNHDEIDNRKSIIKIVSQSKVSHPRGGRLVLRDVSMFLLITNACLWMYMSLDGTAFTTHLYQHHFFGASVWTTILMICRPLSIFFRMHSAGCLFEIWSFA